MSRGRALRLTAAAIGIALGIAGWFLLAPRALGGRLSYVVVARGTSMEPAFHTGDLALVRPAESYGPGQVVAYRSRDLGSTVLHRIVERAADGYVLKGDNNSFLDPEHPRDEDILGALWIRVPVAGSVMGWFRQPLNAAMVAGAAVVAAALAPPLSSPPPQPAAARASTPTSTPMTIPPRRRIRTS